MTDNVNTEHSPAESEERVRMLRELIEPLNRKFLGHDRKVADNRYLRRQRQLDVNLVG